MNIHFNQFDIVRIAYLQPGDRIYPLIVQRNTECYNRFIVDAYEQDSLIINQRVSNLITYGIPDSELRTITSTRPSIPVLDHHPAMENYYGKLTIIHFQEGTMCMYPIVNSVLRLK